METKHTIESIRETNVLGISGIYKILGAKRIFFSTWVEWLSLLLSLITILICWCIELNPFDFIYEIKDLMIDSLPTIIGFTLAGYSLVVGFVQAGMLNKITEPVKVGEDNFSLYQKMSAAFAMNIILQTVALFIAIVIYFLIVIDDKNQKFILLDLVVDSFNWIGLLIISYWFFLSLLLTIQIVINIFGFSQLHQYLINKNKLNKNCDEHQ